MIEILPIRLLRDEDSLIFGSLNVCLAELERSGLPVAKGVVITPPSLHIKTVLEHYEFKSREVFQQSLTLVKKELLKTSVPEYLSNELKNYKKSFFVDLKVLNTLKEVWTLLLELWVEEIKQRLWKDGFNNDLSKNLEPKIIIFAKSIDAFGVISVGADEMFTIEVIKGKLEPSNRKRLGELVSKANKKLFIPHTYNWILDGEVKLVRVSPFTPIVDSSFRPENTEMALEASKFYDNKNTTTKVFIDLSTGLTAHSNANGCYIASERIYNLNKPKDFFEDLVNKIVGASVTYPQLPVLIKLADISEGMGDVRGTLRLIHQQSLLDPQVQALDFIRHKKGLTNVHIVIPFVRNPREISQIKRDLSVKKLMRKNSLQQWLEIAVPENVINLEEYINLGIDGVVLNLDELTAYFNGFDNTREEFVYYKNEVVGILKFLGEGLKLLHKFRIPFIATGSLALNIQVLDFLIAKGIAGIVVERYEVDSIRDLLHSQEKRYINRRSP